MKVPFSSGNVSMGTSKVVDVKASSKRRLPVIEIAALNPEWLSVHGPAADELLKALNPKLMLVQCP
jgi:hypothetical protein